MLERCLLNYFFQLVSSYCFSGLKLQINVYIFKVRVCNHITYHFNTQLQ